MSRKKKISALFTVGILLVITPFVVGYLLPGDPEPDDHEAEYFPVQDTETGKWGFIDKKGDDYTKMLFDWSGDWRQGMGQIEVDGLMGYIDKDFNKTGDYAITPRFKVLGKRDIPARPFFNGLALARADSGKWGYIDRKGKWAIEPRFPENRDYPGMPAGDFSEGLAWFQVVEMYQRNKTDGNGTLIRDADNKPIKEWYPRRKMGYIDTQGEVVIEPTYDVVADFGEGLAGVHIKRDKEWGFIDRAGKRVIPAKFDQVGRFSHGVCAVQLGDLWGYIDEEGEWVIQPQFSQVGDFSNGLAAARLPGQRWGYIDKKGKWVIRPRFDHYDSPGYTGDPRGFENGLAQVSDKGARVYIDKRGRQVWPKDD